MENRTNKVIELENGKEYLILRQILYKGFTFYVTTEIKNDGEHFDKFFTILKEEVEGNDTFIDIVKDEKTLKTILEHIK